MLRSGIEAKAAPTATPASAAANDADGEQTGAKIADSQQQQPAEAVENGNGLGAAAQAGSTAVTATTPEGVASNGTDVLDERLPVLGKKRALTHEDALPVPGQSKRGRMVDFTAIVASPPAAAVAAATASAVAAEKPQKDKDVLLKKHPTREKKTATRSPSPPPVLPASPVFKRELPAGPKPKQLSPKDTLRSNENGDARQTREDGARGETKAAQPRLIRVTIRPLTGDPFEIPELTVEASLLDVKDQIYWLTGIPAERQLLSLNERLFTRHDDSDVKLVRLLPRPRSNTDDRRITFVLAIRIAAGLDAPTHADIYDEEAEFIDDEHFLHVDCTHSAASTSNESSTNDDSNDDTAVALESPCSTLIAQHLRLLSLHPQSEHAETENPQNPVPISTGPAFCAHCKVRCRLAMQFGCRDCRLVFCAVHRYPDKHSCGAFKEKV